MSPRKNYPKNRRPKNNDEDREINPSNQSFEEDENGLWTVRKLTGSSANKPYRCPGCDQVIPMATPHTVAWLDGALTQKYAERAKAARADADKDFGVARFVDGDVTVVADLPKKVEWDQRDLADLVERIKANGKDPRDYVEVSLKVAERNYTSWPNHIRSLFEPSRTVRAGKETFQLIADGDA